MAAGMWLFSPTGSLPAHSSGASSGVAASMAARALPVAVAARSLPRVRPKAGLPWERSTVHVFLPPLVLAGRRMAMLAWACRPGMVASITCRNPAGVVRSPRAWISRTAVRPAL